MCASCQKKIIPMLGAIIATKSGVGCNFLYLIKAVQLWFSSWRVQLAV
jgi:hypothetical protein